MYSPPLAPNCQPRLCLRLFVYPSIHPQNTDAVDVHGNMMWIHRVNFTTGDDNVAMHANG